MAISFTCPKCGAHSEVGDQYAGQTGPCAQCGATITIPGAGNTSAAGSSLSPPPPPTGKSSGSTVAIVSIVAVVGLVGMCAVIGILIALLLPALQAAREAARTAQCTNNLKQIGIAMHAYHEAYDTFPPAYVADETGRPVHSWRVLLLPFLEEQFLYSQYDFDEPWDGPNNSQLAAAMPAVYQCPTNSQQAPYTVYAAITGPGAIFDDADGSKFAEIQDGASNTLLIVEASEANIHWMEPADLNVDEMSFFVNSSGEPSISSEHRRGVNVLYADGSVQPMTDDTDPDFVRALTTKAGGD